MTTDKQTYPILNEEGLEQGREFLVRYAKHHGLQENSASDAVQSAFCATLRQPKRAHTLAYLLGALKNKIKDHFRRSKRTKVFPLDEMPLVDHRTEQTLLDKLIAQSEVAAFLNTLSSRVNEREWDLFLLRYFQNAPRAEICEILRISSGQYGNAIRQLNKKAEMVAVELGIVTPKEKEEKNE